MIVYVLVVLCDDIIEFKNHYIVGISVICVVLLSAINMLILVLIEACIAPIKLLKKKKQTTIK